MLVARAYPRSTITERTFQELPSLHFSRRDAEFGCDRGKSNTIRAEDLAHGLDQCPDANIMMRLSRANQAGALYDGTVL